MQKSFRFYRLFAYLFAAALSHSALADSRVSEDYAKLVNTVQQALPQQAQQAAWQDLAKQYEQQGQRWSGEDVDVHLKHENDLLFGNEQMRNYEIGAQALLQLPAQQQAWQGLAQSTSALSGAQQGYLQWQAVGKLRSISWQLRRAEVEQQAAAVAHQQAQSLLEKVALRKRAGEATELDFLMAQVQVMNLAAQSQAAEKRLDGARQQYQRWTQSTALPAQIDEALLAPLALPQHPHMIWLRAQQQMAQAKLGQAKANQKMAPTVYLGVIHDQAPSADHSTMVAQIILPLGVNQKGQIGIAEEQSNLTATQVDVSQWQLQWQQERADAVQQQATLQQQQTLLQQSLSLSEQKLAMVQKAYELGAMTIESLLRAQQDFLGAQQQLALNKVDLGAAIATLNQLYGHVLSAN
ncbi:hypothetical protein THMIRHAS_23830 [Thiosulfatimonas sediminis]|uniref:TolC family protein n=1 Tax=Thiosulfatimonas sediminis TaxID=2675054 RepID=A0A6F8PYH2_9GAMM|nr:TolC family protein [Thiosulfatimonas sediminis]BBP47010.1 hypothetical protein THMIRHAS_23830 [Thiosulfatimonas sediminis]